MSDETSTWDLSTSWTIICMAYLSAALFALVTVQWLDGVHVVWSALAACLVAVSWIFFLSYAFDNSSLYDPYRSVAPPLLASYWALQAGAEASLLRTLCVVALVTVWAVRLSANFLKRWEGLSDEDWRYVDRRERHGHDYWRVSFFGLHLTPTLIVFVACLPIFPAVSAGDGSFGPLDLVAIAVTGGAIWLEASADRDLREFLRSPDGGKATLTTGLWSRVRHPNYTGEILFWWGLFLFALAADPGWWWSAIGPLGVTALLVFVSVPLIDERMKRRRAGYAEHMRSTPALIPWRRSRDEGATGETT